MLETIIGIFNQLFGTIINILPRSPFVNFINNIRNIPYLEELNWFLPIGEMISVMEVWLTAVAVYYIYSAILRFIRLL